MDNNTEEKPTDLHHEIIGQLSDFWRSALAVSELDIDEQIFSYGADSISMAQIIENIEGKFLVECSFADFFEFTTIRSFSNFIFDKMVEGGR